MDYGHLVGLHLSERDDPLTICVIDARIADAIGAHTTRVTVSLAKRRKQGVSYPDLQLELYQVMPVALRMGKFYQDGERTAVGYLTDTHRSNANFRLAIKAPQKGDELYVLSFFKLRDADMRAQNARALRRGWPCLKEYD